MKYLVFSLAFVSCFSLQAAEVFQIEDLRIEGLQRVSPGTVFSQLPLQTDEPISLEQITQASKQLFTTGLFDDVAVYTEKEQLILRVKERPTLQKLEIEGNKKVSSEDLTKGLSQAGLEEGQIFQRSTLDQIKLELERMYHAQGRYSAKITSEVEELPRNRVAIKIKINEGSVAAIRRINLVGNQNYSNQELLKHFELNETKGWTLFNSADQYSREKLAGDLESLRSWYLDNGYLRFNIESTQVSISPNRQDIFITINVFEGDQYKVSDVELAGELILEEEQLNPYIFLKSGDTFSRSAMTASSEGVRRRLGIEGYTFAEVNGRPDIDDDKKEVKLIFLVDPGRRSYVRKINFAGNISTKDEVLRREMLQLEGASANTDLIKQSKEQLDRLGFFSSVNVENQPSATNPDLIDVNYTVEEQPSGSISASVGYSQSSGVVYGAALSQNNFLGTGNIVSFGANRSDFRTSYNFSYLNPYYTIDGVSRGFNLFYRETDFDEDYGISSYATDAYGANVTYGYPISRNSRLSLSLGFDNTTVQAEKYQNIILLDDIRAFNEEHGLEFFNYRVTGRWTRNLLNRGILATNGSYQSFSLELAAPGSDYQFYKANYRGQKYFKLADNWSLKFRTDLGYGDGLGSEYKQLPFYENYFSGGLSSVRGYRSNSLGQRSTQTFNGVQSKTSNALGGNILMEGSAELIFPLPFIEDQRSMQTSLFLDGGSVYTSRCFSNNPSCTKGVDLDELRYSVGISLTWLTAIGPLAFSIAEPLNDGPDDRTEFFQFSLGQTF
ncbi:outer membrane protein assembly factor BamA [Marinospirillum insulare]|uniref:outer membrane protein assembly factor BamA n=1 Tax=Marinospirillum insulare TaxID=217169 RepID=UPI000482F0B2|nr:outer membrane protein assembly factor BamA [Marinospirillum insulare]